MGAGPPADASGLAAGAGLADGVGAGAGLSSAKAVKASKADATRAAATSVIIRVDLTIASSSGWIDAAIQQGLFQKGGQIDGRDWRTA
jgi:hypothetical protein